MPNASFPVNRRALLRERAHAASSQSIALAAAGENRVEGASLAAMDTRPLPEKGISDAQLA